jgi:hypothetical protein
VAWFPGKWMGVKGFQTLEEAIAFYEGYIHRLSLLGDPSRVVIYSPGNPKFYRDNDGEG